MKKILLVIAGLVLVASVMIGAQEYKEQTGQGCYVGDISNFNQNESDTINRVTWVWQWLPNHNASKSFTACVGPRDYIVYRPLDIAVIGLLISAALLLVAVKRNNKILA